MVAGLVVPALFSWCSAVAAGAAPAPAAVLSAKDGDAALGRRLFLGRVPLRASLRGETSALPVAASRCINCHNLPAPVFVPVPVPRAVGPPRAPAASPALALTAFASRRGGPAFAYDAASLCSTLRTGNDPQQVWLARAMPQFHLAPEQCAALWAYLTLAP